MTSTGLEIRDLLHRFRSGGTVGPISLSVQGGECLGLVGANGAGKTTVLKMICGLLSSQGGSITVNGHRPVRTGQALDVAGMIEEPAFYPFFDGRRNLRAFCGNDRRRLDRVEQALEAVGLDEVTVRYSQYSQGMRQRLGIARILVAAAPVIVLDEPTNGLDPVFLRQFRAIVRGLQDSGHAVLLSSHMLHEVQQMADDYVMMAGGSVVARGRTTALAATDTLEDVYFAAVEGQC